MNVLINNLKIENIHFKKYKNKNKLLYNINNIIIIGIPLSITYESLIKLNKNFILIKLDSTSYRILHILEQFLINKNPNMDRFIILKSIKVKIYNEVVTKNNKINLIITHIDLNQSRVNIKNLI